MANEERIKVYQRVVGHRPWTVLCDFCNQAAGFCLAADISQPGTLRVSYCHAHADLAGRLHAGTLPTDVRVRRRGSLAVRDVLDRFEQGLIEDMTGDGFFRPH